MKKPTYKSGLLALTALGLFAVWAPAIVAAQSQQVFQLGDLEISKADDADQAAEVLAAATEDPSEPVEETAQPTEVVVEVQKGDSLSKIATEHDTTWKRLFDANESIANPNVINPGDKIRIPAADEVLAERAVPVAQPVAVKTASKAKAATGPNTGAPAPAIADGSVWDALARCESGGRWNINTGNGYYGGLQFHPGTWLSNGGGQYAPYAHLATREQQIDIAQRLHAARGFKPWPACSRKLGLL